MKTNQQWLVARYPVGPLQPHDFTWHEAPLAPLATGMVQVRILYLSLDPTNRVWLSEKDSYLPALPIGGVMRGTGVGVVEESGNPAYKPGDIVLGFLGWQRYYTSDGTDLTILPALPDMPLTAHFGLLSHIGLSAYHGMLDIGKPQAGETVVVSGASGAVGSLAGQIAKIQGACVVGIAGSDAKCRRITEELKFDAAINYKTDDVAASLKKYCPKGIDVYFDNVGDTTLDAVLDLINDFGRIVACGMISQYNKPGPGITLKNLTHIVNRRLLMQGYIVLDHLDLIPKAYPELIGWHKAGKLNYGVDLVTGLENAPTALNKLFDGSNTGKLMVKVLDENEPTS